MGMNYIIENYDIDNLSIIEKFASYFGKCDLSALNTFQKVEILKAFVKQDFHLPLTASEEAVLEHVGLH